MVPGIVALVGICVLIALAVGNIYLPPLSYKRSAWLCNDRGFQVRKGIWFRKVTSVPRARVQHTDVQQGPVARSYGLAKLTIHTAGTANSSIEVEGLSLEVASKLRDALIEDRSFEDGV
jgi:membrane protein YdbS with pleckstrin-like domain